MIDTDNKEKFLTKHAKEEKKKYELITKREQFLDELVIPAESGFLETEYEWENTAHITQEDITSFASYRQRMKVGRVYEKFENCHIDYSMDGNNLLVGYENGKCSLFDVNDKPRLISDNNVLERIRDIKICHDENYWAVAQKNEVKIYDKQSIQVHSFSDHKNITKLDYLPYHFLLVSASQSFLKWRDTTTGEISAAHQLTKFSQYAMCHNPWNGVIYTGSSNGFVNLHIPNIKEPALKFIADKYASIDALQPFAKHYVAITSSRNKLFIYDIRNCQKPITSLCLLSTRLPKLSVSKNNIVAVSQNGKIALWKNLHDLSSSKKPQPYLRYNFNDGSTITSLKFKPNDDILTIGLNNGFSSIFIPGSSPATFSDERENPYLTKKQKQQQLIKSLLEKLPADMICIDPTNFGN